MTLAKSGVSVCWRKWAIYSSNFIEEQQSKNMSNFTQQVYVVGENAYSLEYRSTYDPSLVAAKKNNVTLPYTKCHQIFKGPSHFLDPKAQLLFLSLTCNKQETEKSQATMDCSQMMHQSFCSQLGNKKVGLATGQRNSHGKSQSTYGFQTDKNNRQLAKSNIISRKSQHPETNKSCHFAEGKSANSNQKMSFEVDVVEVQSENEAESEDIHELKELLSSKNKQIAHFKSQIRKGHQREQILQKKLKIIRQISINANIPDTNASEEDLDKELRATSEILDTISRTFLISNNKEPSQ